LISKRKKKKITYKYISFARRKKWIYGLSNGQKETVGAREKKKKSERERVKASKNMTKRMMMMLHANTYKSNLEGNHKYSNIRRNARSLNHAQIVLTGVVVKVDTCEKETRKGKERKRREKKKPVTISLFCIIWILKKWRSSRSEDK
jgi:hypothetical protein